MCSPYLRVKRRPYEEPYHVHLDIEVSNGVFCGAVGIYTSPGELAELGSALASFPSSIPSEYRFGYGTSDPAERFYRHFMLRAYTIDNVGHCALGVGINLNEAGPRQATCEFSMTVDPVALNRLGQLFSRFSELEHLELQWTPAGGDLSTHYRADGVLDA